MSVVDDIKARIDIVDLVGSYVPLQKAGRSFKAVCPFHSEKTPSFTVNPDRQTWHCFGACGTGGDIFAFVARKENLDFAGALRLLAERAGVELHSNGPRREELKTLYDVNEAAALFYHSLLTNGNSPARAYAEERGLDGETVRNFELGFSPPGWDGLRDHLVSRGFDEAMLVEAGLIIASDRGGYDRFRGRLMFPIRDDRGRIAGFGGRVLPGSGLDGNETGAKYLNTPQTPIFDKGSILYALDRAKEPMREEGTAVIVEGYMDVIAAHQYGFRNVVASMGTSLTERQAATVQRFAPTVVLAMDADEAGNAANKRGTEILRDVQAVAASVGRNRGGAAGRQRSLDVRVLALPQGKDPDELIRTDAAAWSAAVEAARPVVDHLLAVVAARLDLEDPRQRAALVAEVLPVIGDVADPVLRANYIQQLAQKARMGRMGEETLSRQLVTIRRQAIRPAARSSTTGSALAEGQGSAGLGTGQGGPEAEAAASSFRQVRALREEYCLAMLYTRPEVAQLASGLTDDLFSLSENRELLRRWRAGETISEDEPALWEPFQRIMATRLPEFETSVSEKAFLDCLARLDQSRMREVKEASALALAEGEAGVRPGQVVSIARARWEAGQSEENSPGRTDDRESLVASQLLDDMEAGLRFHRRLIEGERSDHLGKPSREGGQE